MGNRIPEETLEEIRKSVDIVDIVSEYVQLKRQGRNYFGLCPFHGENTPSFSVAPDKQIYHCFGCGAGGNMFSFIMDIEGLSFTEAAQYLAEKANVTLPEESASPTSDARISREDKEMLRAHELLQKLFHHILLNTNEGERPLHYLQERGFDEGVIKTFQIGYAPKSWELQTTFLDRRGFSLEMMERAGLLAMRREDGRFFDRFRDRVIFPIANLQGKSIAFGGRVIEREDEPKYLNSPETSLYHKSKILYAFHLARPEIRKKQQAVLFEGYLDVISAWQAGVKNGVASLGTSLTPEQVRLIRRNADSVIICYDADDAGIEATFRAAKMLTEAGCYVTVAKLPHGYDPDDYIRKYGAESFKNGVIGDSQTLMAFKIQYLRRGKNLQNEGERIHYIEEVLKEVSRLPKAVERDHYLRQLADEFSISLDALHEQQRQIFYQTKQKDKQVLYRDNKTNHPAVKRKILPAYHNAEKMLLACMLKDADIALKVQEKIGLSFNIDEHNAIAILLYGFFEEGNEPNISSFMERIDDTDLKRIVSEVAMQDIDDHVEEQVIVDYINQIKRHVELEKIKSIEAETVKSHKQHDPIKAAEILNDILRKKRELKGP